MSKRQKVYMGCRDCKGCTNSSYANAGRKMGRGLAAFTTSGISEVARGGTKNCSVCGHKLSLHYGSDYVQSKPVSNIPSITTSQAPAGWYPDKTSNEMRYWDGSSWGLTESQYKQQKDEEASRPKDIEPRKELPVSESRTSLTVEERLVKLKKLYEQDLLTEDEYSLKRSQLISEL